MILYDLIIFLQRPEVRWIGANQHISLKITETQI